MSALAPAIPALDKVVALRRTIHAHPEIGFEEFETSRLVCKWLTDHGIQYKAGLAKGTGVVAWLPATQNPDSAKTIAVRADMDALPIQEENVDLDYCSKVEGKMHACGHDGHTAILCGAAATLAAMGTRPHNVLFFFQPAEEGMGGAYELIKDGALEGKVIGKPVDAIYGLHGFNLMDVGQVSTCDGPMLASADTVFIDVLGKGGHAAAPHFGVDPVVVASHLILALQTIVSRGSDPLDSLVITMPMFHAGTAHNVIPNVAKLEGTFRTLRTETREFAMRRIREVAEGVAAAHGAQVDVRFAPLGYPVTKNDPVAADRFRRIIRGSNGPELAPDCVPVMGGEDFSFYGEAGVPACFFWLGLRPKGADFYPFVHTPTFNFNDDAIPYGIRAMVELATAPL